MPLIVMTGATSGIGQIAAERLSAEPDTELLLGARHPLQPNALPLDLGRLESARAFAAEVVGRIGERRIDALVLNAGAAFRAGECSADGYEATFAVNHLGHYALLRLLLPHLADGARVVLTTSSTHDPDRHTPLPPPDHADAALLARPGGNPQRAYTSSKLCNVLTARALASQPDAHRKSWRVIAFDPGPTPGTGLSRNMNPALRLVWRILASPAGRLIPGLTSPERAGTVLAALATTEPVGGSGYASVVRGELTWPEPSPLARSDEARDALWRDSAALTGLV